MKELCIMPPSHLYETERREGLHRHEVFYGYNRQKSIKYGLVVFLHPALHNMRDKGVHFNKDFNLALKKIGQQAFMKHYPDLDFQKIFGNNYLQEDV